MCRQTVWTGMAVAIAAFYNTDRAREEGYSTAARSPGSVTQFKVYEEDYLHSKVTSMDAYDLKVSQTFDFSPLRGVTSDISPCVKFLLFCKRRQNLIH